MLALAVYMYFVQAHSYNLHVHACTCTYVHMYKDVHMYSQTSCFFLCGPSNREALDSQITANTQLLDL